MVGMEYKIPTKRVKFLIGKKNTVEAMIKGIIDEKFSKQRPHFPHRKGQVTDSINEESCPTALSNLVQFKGVQVKMYSV